MIPEVATKVRGNPAVREGKSLKEGVLEATAIENAAAGTLNLPGAWLDVDQPTATRANFAVRPALVHQRPKQLDKSHHDICYQRTFVRKVAAVGTVDDSGPVPAALSSRAKAWGDVEPTWRVSQESATNL